MRSWIDPLMNAYTKPKDKNIAALTALELQSMPKKSTGGNYRFHDGGGARGLKK